MPPKTPPEIVAKLEAAFLEIANNPEIQAEMNKQGFIPLAVGAAASKAHLDKLTAQYKAMLQDIKAATK